MLYRNGGSFLILAREMVASRLGNIFTHDIVSKEHRFKIKPYHSTESCRRAPSLLLFHFSGLVKGLMTNH